VKRRLEDIFDDSARIALVLAMLKDALAAAIEANRIDHVLVLTTDAELGRVVDLSPAETFIAETGSLNGDLRAGLRHAAEAGADAALVVLPDLPLLTGRTLDTLIRAAGQKGNVVIASDWHGLGTNALFLRPPNTLAPQFGSNSLANHSATAGRARLRMIRFATEETALDLDDAEAVTKFLQVAASSPAARATNTFHALSRLLKLSKDSRSWAKNVLNRAKRKPKDAATRLANEEQPSSRYELH
jgi:2-phospho-L-lactate guanylyltransferase